MRISILTIGAVASIIAINQVFADTTVTSKTYVDNQDAALYDELDEIKQNTIPAAGVNDEENGGGVSVVTYTTDAGVLGERFICDAVTHADGDCVDDYLVTRGVLGNVISQAVPRLPTKNVTTKTCTAWAAGAPQTDPNCILWNLENTTVEVSVSCSSGTDCNGLRCTGGGLQCNPSGVCDCGGSVL